VIGGSDEFTDDAPYRPTDAEWRLLDRLDRSSTDREAMSAVHVLSRIPFARICGAIDRLASIIHVVVCGAVRRRGDGV